MAGPSLSLKHFFRGSGPAPGATTSPGRGLLKSKACHCLAWGLCGVWGADPVGGARSPHSPSAGRAGLTTRGSPVSPFSHCTTRAPALWVARAPAAPSSPPSPLSTPCCLQAIFRFALNTTTSCPPLPQMSLMVSCFLDHVQISMRPMMALGLGF